MRHPIHAVMFVVLFLSRFALHANNTAGGVKKAGEHITLDQPGTKPFHLRAVVAPTFVRE
jgi:hypothetical protein